MQTPATSLRVLWVGHSLMNHRDPHASPPRNILEKVADFAEHKGLQYQAIDHTLFGSPLSLLWRGSPHGFHRAEPQMRKQRETLLAKANTIDAVVMTELIPVRKSLKGEHSAYYAQQFACAVWKANPKARVYVYEAWSHLNASTGASDYGRPSTYDWAKQLAADRKFVEQLADLASTTQVPSPGLFSRFSSMLGRQSTCVPSGAISLIPVGSVYRKLASLLQHETLEFKGRNMNVGDLFANAYTAWPNGWPLAEALPVNEENARLTELKRHYPEQPLDDIHPSDLGIYVASLVHFSTLYSRSPIGLPNLTNGMPDNTDLRIKELVWQVVSRELTRKNDP